MSLNIATTGLVALALLVACSAGSGDGAGSGGGTPSGSGASSSTGATGATGAGSSPSTGAGASSGTGAVLGAGAGPSGTGGTADVENGTCAQQNFVVSSKPADVLLVLDRSKSMIEHDVAPGVTRWQAVVPALTSVITATNATVSWGLKVFPVGTDGACQASTLADVIDAEIMPANAAKMNSLITGTMALGNGTPTANAITQATAYLQKRGASNQYILLATDGEPSCPSGGDAGRQAAYAAISAAATAGYKTFVVGVLDPVEDDSAYEALNKMAELGGTSRSDNPVGEKFYFAGTQASLAESLQAVTGQVASCVFEFTKAPPDPTNIAVKVNGVKIAEDPSKAGGWSYLSEAHLGVELFGAACEEVKDATENKVDIIFGCKGMPIL